MSSFVRANNRTKNILILGGGITPGLDDTTLTAEKMYSINFTVSRREFCLSLHYNESNSYLFANGTEIIKFKEKGSLCLGNILEDFSVANMKQKLGFCGSVFDYRFVLITEMLQLMIH